MDNKTPETQMLSNQWSSERDVLDWLKSKFREPDVILTGTAADIWHQVKSSGKAYGEDTLMLYAFIAIDTARFDR